MLLPTLRCAKTLGPCSMTLQIIGPRKWFGRASPTACKSPYKMVQSSHTRTLRCCTHLLAQACFSLLNSLICLPLCHPGCSCALRSTMRLCSTQSDHSVRLLVLSHHRSVHIHQRKPSLHVHIGYLDQHHLHRRTCSTRAQHYRCRLRLQWQGPLAPVSVRSQRC